MARRGAGTAATSAWRPEPYIEYCIQGPAVSGQSKNRARLRAWKATVAAAARAAWPDRKIPMPDSVYVDVHISEFSAFATVDRDNLSKPVLDAMQTIVYENDRQLKHWDVE
jgi:Holliday junction resolvase RusA-like endonuclease